MADIIQFTPRPPQPTVDPICGDCRAAGDGTWLCGGWPCGGLSPKWLPIADFPDDIDRAIVWGEHSLNQEFDEESAYRAAYTASWLGKEWGSCWRADGEGFVNGVTHWMPIPASPLSNGHRGGEA